jgi:hypothetical protein
MMPQFQRRYDRRGLVYEKKESIMTPKGLLSFALTASMMMGAIGLMPQANASQCWRDSHSRLHCNNGHRYSRYQGRDYYYDDSRSSWVDYQTGKILKGGLVGAGIGAGSGLLTGRSVGRQSLIGAGIGAGVQATRYSNYMYRHPIVKTAAYGALAGTGVGSVTGDGRVGRSALWGAAIGTGVGALDHMR